MNNNRTGTKLAFQLSVSDDVFNVGEYVNLTFDPKTEEPDRIVHNHEDGLWQILWLAPAGKGTDRAFKVEKVR
jgi:hypothetical protein